MWPYLYCVVGVGSVLIFLSNGYEQTYSYQSDQSVKKTYLTCESCDSSLSLFTCIDFIAEVEI